MSFQLIGNGPILISTTKYHDDRGYFFESYQLEELSEFGIQDRFIQDNISFSKKNVLRGMHYQTNPVAQSKLVRCVKGDIKDVCVDIRKDSPNYGKYYSYNLSENNGHLLYVPVGFAHGFIVRSDEALVIYKTNNLYSPENEAGFIWNDPGLNIDWGVDGPIVSEKDRILPLFNEAKNNFYTYPKDFGR